MNTWPHMRRAAGLKAFSWDINQRRIERHGFGVPQSPILSDVLMGRRLHEFRACCARPRPATRCHTEGVLAKLDLGSLAARLLGAA